MDHPDGQRVAVCVDGTGSAIAAVGVVDPSGDRARADRAGVTSTERASRADAQDAEGGDDAATGREPVGRSRCASTASAGVQRGASTRGAGAGDARHRCMSHRRGSFLGNWLSSSTRVTSRRATSARTAGFAGRSAWVNVTTTLAHEWVGLEEVGDGLWDVYFSRLRLGRLDERRMRDRGSVRPVVTVGGFVTYVPGQICHPCPRLNTEGDVLIVHGVYHWKRRLVGFRNDYCIRCDAIKLALQQQTVDVLHVLFVPILPLGVWKRWRCATCGSDPHARVRTYRSVKWAGTMLLGFITGVGWMASTDGYRGDGGCVWSLRIGGALAFALALRSTIKSPPDADLATRLRAVPPLDHSVCGICGGSLASVGAELKCSKCGAAWRALEAA